MTKCTASWSPQNSFPLLGVQDVLTIGNSKFGPDSTAGGIEGCAIGEQVLNWALLQHNFLQPILHFQDELVEVCGFVGEEDLPTLQKR